MQRIGRYTVLLCHRISVRRKTIKPDSIDDIIDIDLVTTEQKSLDQGRDIFRIIRDYSKVHLLELLQIRALSRNHNSCVCTKYLIKT